MPERVTSGVNHRRGLAPWLHCVRFDRPRNRPKSLAEPLATTLNGALYMFKVFPDSYTFCFVGSSPTCLTVKKAGSKDKKQMGTGPNTGSFWLGLN